MAKTTASTTASANRTAKDVSRDVSQESHGENPKIQDGDASNRIKDPDEWTTGSEPMTGAQASYLKTLSEETHEPDAFAPDLDKAEASKRIDALRKEAGRG